jgi:RNA polymerase sigma-70 factor (ECF subfamily)
MVRAWRHIENVPLEFGNARRWLFAVARRIAIDAARLRKTHPVEVDIGDSVWVPSAYDATEETIAAQSIVSAFRALRPDQQLVLTELHLNGRSVADIAERLEVPKGTVKSRVFYGLQSLREALVLPA